jgi:nuclear transport factor 2 (NTF2) superfamily protein
MSYHLDADWRTRPAPIIDRNKLQRLRRRARARGLLLLDERDGYHRAMGRFHLSWSEDGGQTWQTIFGPAPLDVIEAKLDAIIEAVETYRRRRMQ